MGSHVTALTLVGICVALVATAQIQSDPSDALRYNPDAWFRHFHAEQHGHRNRRTPGCNVTYCYNHGNATVAVNGACICYCRTGFSGIRCQLRNLTFGSQQPTPTAPPTPAPALNPVQLENLNCVSTTVLHSQQLCVQGPRCFWDSNTSRCIFKQNATFNSSAQNDLNEPRAWCYDFFSTPIIVLMYFCASGCVGFGFIGVVYVGYYRNTPIRTTIFQQTFQNQLLHSYGIVISYAGALSLSSFLLMITAAYHFSKEDSCAYVGFGFIWLGVASFGFIQFAVPILIRWWKSLHEIIQPHIDIDSAVRPSTDESTTTGCAVRTF
jgi:hypothetical protein